MAPRLTRRGLIAGGIGGLAGAAVTGAVGAASAVASPAPIPETERLQRLIRIELLLLFCYRHVLGASILGPVTRARISPFLAHEQAHIAALEQRLRARGGTVPPGPAGVRAANRDLAHRNVGGRLGQLKGDLDAVRLLLTLEQVTIGAYTAALQDVSDPELIDLIVSIMGAEAQHDALLGLSLPPYKPGSAAPYGLVGGLR